MKQNYHRCILFLSLSLGLPSGFAQAATPSATTPAKEDAVVLNPFLVTSSADTGYAATNTLDGSRLNTALRDTPAAISVFTKDFLDDIGATDVASLLRYDLSTEFEFNDANSNGTGGQVGSIDGGQGWRTRGLTGAASTNGFRDAGGADDLYNVERVGSTRGPNAILFGTGASGGVLNLRTKIADPRRNLHSFEFKIGDHDVKRGTFDVNRVLLDRKIALRLLGMYDYKGSHIPHIYAEKRGATLAAQYRFSENTSLRASFEKNQMKGIGGRPWGIQDSVTAFLNAVNSGQVRLTPSTSVTKPQTAPWSERPPASAISRTAPCFFTGLMAAQPLWGKAQPPPPIARRSPRPRASLPAKSPRYRNGWPVTTRSTAPAPASMVRPITGIST